MGTKRKWWIGATLALVAMLAGWVAADLASHASPQSLRAFDGREVGALETAMWRSYYGHSASACSFSSPDCCAASTT